MNFSDTRKYFLAATIFFLMIPYPHPTESCHYLCKGMAAKFTRTNVTHQQGETDDILDLMRLAAHEQ